MAKRRTGLQSDISSIFSGVPVPKKDSPPQKPDAPSKPVVPPPPEQPAEPADVKPPQPAPPPDSPAKPADAEKPHPPAAPKQKSIPEPASIPKHKVVEPVPVVKPEVSKPTVIPEPVKTPDEPAVQKVIETKKFGPKVKQIPTKVPRRRKDRFAATKSGVSAGRKTASIVMVVILSVTLVFLLARPHLTSRSNPVIANISGQPNTSTISGPNVEINWPEPPVYYSYYRDPMNPESKGRDVPKATQDIVVSGIVYSEDDPRAIIDGQYYGVGEKVNGATIIKITRSSITFERDGKTWTQGVQK